MFDEYLDEELQTSTLTCNEEHFYDVHKDILDQQIATSAFVDIFNNDLLFDSNQSSVEEGSDKELLEPFIQSSSVEQYISEISHIGFTESKQQEEVIFGNFYDLVANYSDSIVNYKCSIINFSET